MGQWQLWEVAEREHVAMITIEDERIQIERVTAKAPPKLVSYMVFQGKFINIEWPQSALGYNLHTPPNLPDA